MTLVLLVRHGLTASTGKALTGWLPGVALDERGRAQAQALGERLAKVPLQAIVSSPLERCRQTAELIAAARADCRVDVDERVGEVRYGDWTGQSLKRLAHDPLWRVVQAHPSAARFPGADGESLADVAHRATSAIREWNARLGGASAYLVCSHGDVIKTILADALGTHLDAFQRIVVDPCSLSVVRYTPLRPFVLRVNDTMPEVSGLLSAREGTKPQVDAPVGGGSGS